MIRRAIDIFLVAGFVGVLSYGIYTFGAWPKTHVYPDALVVMRFIDYSRTPSRLAVGTDCGVFYCRDELTVGRRYKLTVRDSIATGRRPTVVSYSEK